MGQKAFPKAWWHAAVAVADLGVIVARRAANGPWGGLLLLVASPSLGVKKTGAKPNEERAESKC